METVAGKISKVLVLDRVAGKAVETYVVTVEALKSGAATKMTQALTGWAKWLNLRTA